MKRTSGNAALEKLAILPFVLLALAFGIGSAYLSLGFFFHSSKLLFSGVEATASVVEVSKTTTSGSSSGAVVEFVAVDGETYRISPEMQWVTTRYKLGESISVLYLADAPSQARINESGELLLPGFMWGLFALLIFRFGKDLIVPSEKIKLPVEAHHQAVASYLRKRSYTQLLFVLGLGFIFSPMVFSNIALIPCAGVRLLQSIGGVFLLSIFLLHDNDCPCCGEPLPGEDGVALFGAVPDCEECEARISM